MKLVMRKWSVDFKTASNNDGFYDLLDDWSLIESSFATQYGIRLRNEDDEAMSWGEFSSLLAGILPETPLGQIVSLRSENDKDRLKLFSKEQLKIRSDWRNRKKTNKEIKPEDYDKAMDNFKNLFKSMSKST